MEMNDVGVWVYEEREERKEERGKRKEKKEKREGKDSQEKKENEKEKDKGSYQVSNYKGRTCPHDQHQRLPTTLCCLGTVELSAWSHGPTPTCHPQSLLAA